MSVKYSFTFVKLRGQCLDCGKEFESLQLSDFLYGYKMLRSPDGSTIAVLCCLDNPVFDEVCSIVQSLVPGDYDDYHEAKLMNRVIGVACDPIDDKELDASIRAVCPYCRSQTVDEFDFVPPQWASIGVYYPTYANWQARSSQEKRELIQNKLLAKRASTE